jgi:hypothetical protein
VNECEKGVRRIFRQKFTGKERGGRCEGFCPSTHVLALVPTTSNPAVYGLFVYQTCTLSVPFRRKTARNRGSDGGPVLAGANLQVGPTQAGKTPKMSPGISSTEIPPVLAAGAKGGENVLPDAQERKQGPFPPQETAFYDESAQTFEARNDLAGKTPRPSDLTGPSRP